MKAITVVFVVLLLLATPMASDARTINLNDRMHKDEPNEYRNYTNAPQTIRTAAVPVLTNLRTSPGDTVVAVQNQLGVWGLSAWSPGGQGTYPLKSAFEFRGDSTFLAPGTVILTNAEIKLHGRVIIGDSTNQDTRQVKIIATGLRPGSWREDKYLLANVDKDAGVYVYGSLVAHGLRIEGFRYTDEGWGDTSGKITGGNAICVQRGGTAFLYNCQTEGNGTGLQMPNYDRVAQSSGIAVVRTYQCSLNDSLFSMFGAIREEVFGIYFRADYKDEYSRFSKPVDIYINNETGANLSGRYGYTFKGSELGGGIIDRLRGLRDANWLNTAWVVSHSGGLIRIITSADFNGDGGVDFDDFFLFAAAFGQKVTSDSAKYDLDSSGTVDFGDFFIFAEAFGKKQ